MEEMKVKKERSEMLIVERRGDLEDKSTTLLEGCSFSSLPTPCETGPMGPMTFCSQI